VCVCAMWVCAFVWVGGGWICMCVLVCVRVGVGVGVYLSDTYKSRMS